MRRMWYAVALLAVSILLLNAGCYTVLQHPTGSGMVQQDTYQRSCADCHADAAYYHPYNQPYYNSHDRWGGYYGSYWWYDDYYWYDPCYDDDDYIGPKVETGTRHLWGSSGWATGGWGFTKPGSGSSSTPSPANQTTKKDNKKKAETKQKEKEKKKEKEKEKEDEDERNLWKEPKKGF